MDRIISTPSSVVTAEFVRITWRYYYYYFYNDHLGQESKHDDEVT